MFKNITRKDKRTNLEKEIDSVLDVMSNIKPDPEEDSRTNLEKEIDSVLSAMSNVAPESEDYENMAKTLETLYKAKANDVSKLETYSEMANNLEKLYKAKANEKNRKISPDTMAVVAGNLLGIALILWHEKANVITTKALGFVVKGRV